MTPILSVITSAFIKDIIVDNFTKFLISDKRSMIRLYKELINSTVPFPMNIPK